MVQIQKVNEQVSDEVLMQRYIKGDERAFQLLFQRYRPILLGLMRRQGANAVEASDYVQQTFLQLFRARHDYRSGMQLRPYLRAIAVNVRRSALRRQGRHPEEAVWESEPTEPMDDREFIDPIERKQEATRIRTALAQLPANQREVLEMHWFDGLSFREIAATVGTSFPAVKVRASRGYGRLRKILDRN